MKEKKLRYALTHPQQRVWYTEKLHPGTGMWNNAGTLKIRGRLDYALLERAVNLFVEENESIRLRIGQSGTEPYQYISDYQPFPVDVLDFTERGVDKLYEWDSLQTQAPMPLLDTDLYYCSLFKLGENEGGIYAKFHHIISDALSLVEFSNQVMASYEALLSGAGRGPNETRSYIEYIEEENAYIGSKRFEYDRKYWTAQFQELPEPTVIKQKKTNDLSVEAQRKVYVIPEADSNDIHRFCERTEISAFSLFLSALAIYINRITGKSDIIIGAPVVNRTSKGAKGAFGMFVSTVPIRIRIEDGRTFTEFAQVVSGQWFSALKHQKYPYDILMQDLRRKHPSLGSLYDVTLSYQIGTFEKDAQQFTYEGRWHFPGYQAGPLAIHVNDREANGRLIVDYDHHSPFFSAKEIEYYHAHLMNIVRDIIEHPDKKLYMLDLLEPEERERILYRFNDTHRRYPTEATLCDLWYESAARTPADQTAVAAGGREMTYGELDSRSSALALHLKRLGTGPGDIVGVLSRRTLDYPVCVLAVLKAGAAYLPIDAELPGERISYMLADSGAVVLLASPDLAEQYRGIGGLSVVKTTVPLALPSSNYIEPVCTKDDLAYVIYTSGSTGQPKGVQISHGSIAHFVYSMDDIWDFSPGARLLGAASISFDISVMELVLALTRGAVLVLAREHEVNIPKNMVELIRQQRVNMLVVTPGRMELLLSDPQGAACLRDFREVGMGGDVLPEKLLARVQQSTGARIINFYGPTEITVCCTCTDVTHAKIPNIGSPMPNVKAYILDPHLLPVPIGVPGELFVGGRGVARGYIGKPELNAERFVDNPFEPESRLYRTGDLARWYPLGEIEFLGRIDKQVKIRGYRIELGEIENRLMQIEGISSCTVADRADAAGRKVLCAYLCGNVPPVPELKAQLMRDLPQYMMPSYFVEMDSLPMNASGKVDRHRLPDPAAGAAQRDDFSPPASQTEQALAEIWQDVLGVDQVGRNDSFFDIGGDSLSIVTVMAQIPQAFHVEIRLEDVYRSPQLCAFAALIDTAERSAYRPIVPAMPADDYPVSSAQQRMWVLERADGGAAAYNVPMAFWLDGRVDTARLQRAFEALIARHDALRTSFVLRGTELRQKVEDTAAFHLQVVRAGKKAIGETLRGLVRPFDMRSAPLMRAAVVKTGIDEMVLLIDLHHSIADRRTAEVLMRDLAALYTDTALPPKTFEYKDYAVWQQDYMRSESIALQRAFWQSELEGELPLLGLHTDRPRAAEQQFSGARVAFELDARVAEKLRAFAAQHGATPFMAVLAVYNVLLARYTGQEDIIVGTPVSGRSRQEVQDIAGVFINTLPLRNFPEAALGFDAFMDALAGRCVSAFAHADYPLERMIGDLKLRRDPSRNPLFDTMLVQTAEPQPLRLGDVQARHCAFDPGIAKLDLTLEVFEGPGALGCQFEYNTALWDETAIVQMAAHFVRLADILTDEPQTRIRDAAMLTPGEVWQLTVGLNRTDKPLPDISVQSLFEDHAARHAGKTAVAAQDGRLTFGELNARANRAARILAGMGVGRNTVAALCLPRTSDLLVALLAVLKAGGAYLPIDPEYPPERISLMLADSGAKVMLTTPDTRVDFAGETVLMNDIPADGSAANLPRTDRDEDAAYVIYTSGSTGKPKGAALPRRGLKNLYFDALSSIAYDTERPVVSVTTVAFDIFIGDAVLPLLAGCTVVLCSEEELRQPHLLAALIGKEKPAFIQTTPTRMRIMMDDAGFRAAAAKHIEKIVLGGEMIPPSLLAQLKEVTGARVINGYGPTEATVYSSFKDLSHETKVNIGRPVSNTRMYILDRFKRPVPTGVPGELYISGAGVASGYIGRDELTRRVFVPDPFWPGHMMYQTGDVCVFLPSGEIEICGRADNQVKIRGLRIELGEIEAAMRAMDGIGEAVVKDWGQGEKKYLCAYYEAPEPADEAQMRRALAAQMPVYMVPSYFVHMRELPATLSGKVDRKALAEPVRQTGRQPGGDQPMNAAERTMSGVWSEVLGIGNVGRNDNFFALGGDSLAVIKVQAAVLQYGWTIRTRDFYEAQTLCGVVQCLNAGQAQAHPAALAQRLGERVGEFSHLEPAPMRRVLLTGATGFLGAHLLAALAPGTHANCLVRGEGEHHAARRLHETLSHYFGAKRCSEILSRVSVFCGDAEKEEFGLGRKAGAALSGVDTVVHTAANTDHMGPESAFYSANVLGTRNAAAMAERAGAALLHVSTTSVAGTHIEGERDRQAEFDEQSYYIGQNYADNVYVKSKFKAEEIVLEALERGRNARILRVGNLCATADGRFQKDPSRNAFAGRVAALCAIGCAPVGMLDTRIEMTPVDACAEAILTLCGQPQPRRAIHHVFNTNTMTVGGLVSLLEQNGRRIEIVSDEAFMTRMHSLSRSGELEHLKSLMDDISRFGDPPKIVATASATAKMLSKNGFFWPVIDAEYMGRYLSSIAQISTQGDKQA